MSLDLKPEELEQLLQDAARLASRRYSAGESESIAPAASAEEIRRLFTAPLPEEGIAPGWGLEHWACLSVLPSGTMR